LFFWICILGCHWSIW